MLIVSKRVSQYIAGLYENGHDMLKIIDHIPPGFLDTDATQMQGLLEAPTLMHCQGRREQPLFVSVLLHGNEITGLQAIQDLLRKYKDQDLPRSLSIFIGNVSAAAKGMRRLDGQPDYNRTWPGTETTNCDETLMMQQVKEEMRARNVFASIDIHNNTGINPHYAYVNFVDDSFLHLATLFSRTVVYFTRPLGVQSASFADLCPSVTIECGKVGQQYAEKHAMDFVDAALHLSEMPEHTFPEQDIDLFHTLAIVKIPELASFSFNGDDADICFDSDLDHMNFRELERGTRFGKLCKEKNIQIEAWNNDGINIGQELFEYKDNEILTCKSFMPSMLTLNEKVIRQDCLCYVMERYKR